MRSFFPVFSVFVLLSLTLSQSWRRKLFPAFFTGTNHSEFALVVAGVVGCDQIGQIGLLMICDWGVVGIPGMILACLVGTPIAVILGIFCGAVLNRAKGREMVTSYILGFFINGVYQLVVLYFMGWIIPITNPALLLSRGYGVRNAVSLLGIRGVLDNLIPSIVAGTTQCQRERCILPRAYSVL